MFNIFTVIKKWFKGLDKNNDGVVNAADAVVVIKNVADVNNDGVVNAADAKVVAAVVKEKIKKTKSQLNKMTKSGIQSYGLRVGVEVDRSLTKRQMIELLLQK